MPVPADRDQRPTTPAPAPELAPDTIPAPPGYPATLDDAPESGFHLEAPPCG
jgi:hypothetical protein